MSVEEGEGMRTEEELKGTGERREGVSEEWEVSGV